MTDEKQRMEEKDLLLMWRLPLFAVERVLAGVMAHGSAFIPACVTLSYLMRFNTRPKIVDMLMVWNKTHGFKKKKCSVCVFGGCVCSTLCMCVHAPRVITLGRHTASPLLRKILPQKGMRTSADD